MALRYYEPWWIHTADPFSVEEEPYNIFADEDLLSLNDIGLNISRDMPELWDLAGNVNVSQAQIATGADGKPSFTAPEWPDEMKDSLAVPSNRAMYLLDTYEPLVHLREQSAYHNLDIGFMEKFGYSVDEAFEQGFKIGMPGILASATKGASLSLDAISDKLDIAYEKYFGDDKVNYFSSQDEKDMWEHQYKDKIDRIRKEKEKDKPDVKTFKFLDDLNEWAERTAIKNIKSFEKRHAKDLRYKAWQQYAANKPVGWLTTFKSPEYFTDTILSMGPSVVVMGASMGAGIIAGAPAAVGAAFVGHFPLEASGSYTEAYTWTKEETGDEELAKANAAWSTAQMLTILAVTEGWGSMRWFNRIMPKNIINSAKNKAFRGMYKGNVSDAGKRTVLGEMASNWNKGIGVPKRTYDIFKDPAAEALQEYVQYAGTILSESGYKDESQNIVDILTMNHPLVDDTELHESVVGGALFGGGAGVSTYFGKKLLWNNWTNRANEILSNEYGVDTGVPNVDLSEESGYNVPAVVGDVAPTLENYLKELLYPKRDERVVVSREQADGTPLGDVIDRQKGYTNSAVAEKLAESIISLGEDEWDKVSDDTKASVNSHLKGAIQNIRGGEDILDAKILDNNDNIAKDILDGKIVFQSTRVGTKITSTSKRKLKIKDKGYADSIIKMYESEISASLEGKEITPANTRNYLAREYGIELDKGLKKEITSSIQKHVEGEISTVVQKEAEKQAEKQIEQEMEKETLKAIQKQVGIKEYKDKKEVKGVSPSVIGQAAVILEGKHKGESGKITVHDDKRGLVAIRLDDGTRVGPLKESEVALTQMPTAPKAPTKPTPPKEPTKVKTNRVVDKVVALSDDAKRLARSFIALKDAKLTQREAIELTEKGEEFEGFDFSEDGKDWDIIVKELTDTGVFKKVSIKDKYVSSVTGEDVFYDSSSIVFDKATFPILKDYFLEVKPKAPTKPKWLTPEVHESLRIYGMSDKDIGSLTREEAEGIVGIDVPTEPSKVKAPKKKKPTAKQELKQKVNKVLDIKSEYDALTKSIELQKAAGELSPEDSKKLASLKSKLATAHTDIDIREELSKRGVLKAIERIIIEDETPQQKKFHKIGDDYEKGQRKATKAFIAKALKEVMGKHAPDINKTLVNEIKEDPSAVGAYGAGMVEFILGRSTQHTAYHEPIHWFMNRVLDDKDYNSVIEHFGDEESATSAAADWYMGQKDRTLTEKIIDIFRKFWIAVQKFLNRQVSSEDTIFDIFSRIGRDFTLRNFKDRMAEYDIGADVDFDGIDEAMLLPEMSETSFDELLEELYKVPVSEYTPRQKTLQHGSFILHMPSKSGSFNLLSAAQIPSSDHSRISLPYEYSFSNNLAQTKTEKISLGAPFSTKGLPKYEAAVVKSFYKNAIEAEWTEGKKSVDKGMLIAQYESYIEDEFPLNAYAVRYQNNNINKHGVAIPTLFQQLLPNATTNNISNDFFSVRVMLTDQDFYDGFGHSFQLDPSSAMRKMTSDEQAESEIGQTTPVNGLGWYVYVEPRIKNIKQLEGLSLVYEFQQDINDVIDKMDNTGQEDIRYGLLSQFAQQITTGQATPEEAARNELWHKAMKFANKRMKTEAGIRGDIDIVNFFVRTVGTYGKARYILTQDHGHKSYLNEVRNKLKAKISSLDREINLNIRKGIVNRMMQKIEYNETVKWNEFIKSLPTRKDIQKQMMSDVRATLSSLAQKDVFNLPLSKVSELAVDYEKVAKLGLSEFFSILNIWKEYRDKQASFGDNPMSWSEFWAQVSHISREMGFEKEADTIMKNVAAGFDMDLERTADERIEQILGEKIKERKRPQVSGGVGDISKEVTQYVKDRFTDILVSLTPTTDLTGKEGDFLNTGSSSGHGYIINAKTGNVLGVNSISSILNKIGIDKEGKKYVLETLKRQGKTFDNVVKTLEGLVPHPTGLGGIMETSNILDFEGVELMFRDNMYAFFEDLVSRFRDELGYRRGELTDVSFTYDLNLAMNRNFGQIISNRKKSKSKIEVGNRKRNRVKRRLQWKRNSVFTDNEAGQRRAVKVAQSYVDKYNRQVKGLVKNLQDKIDNYVESLEIVKSSLSPAELGKTEKLRNEQNRFKEIAIHHSILTAHSRGNRTWGIGGALAHLKLEGSSNVDTAKLYLNEFELYDSERVKTYEEWKVKSLGQINPKHMAFVDAYFGMGRGNHLKSDEQITEELEKFKTHALPWQGGESIPKFKTSHDVTVMFMNLKWYSHKGHSDKNKIEITYEEAKNYYIDAPKLGPIWTATRKVLRKLGLKAEYKNYSALAAPIAIVRLPDNEIEMAPVKRFHRIEEEPEFEKKESKAQELARKTGVKDQSSVVKDTIMEDAVNLSRAVQKFNIPEKIKDLFSVSFNKAKDKYGIEVADYVPIMGKALRVIPDRENRDMAKNLLSEWAVSVDPDVGIKMRSDNKSIQLIELMGLTGRKQRRIKRQIADLDVVENIERTLAGQGAEDSHDLVREGLQVSDITDMEEIENNNEIEVYNFADDRFFKFLESTKSKGYLSPEETAELMSQVVLKDFGEFTSYLITEHEWEPVSTADNNMVRSFWLRNQPINRQSSFDKPGWWYANMTYDGKVLSSRDDKRLVPKVGGHPKYGKDIRNNKDLPRTTNVSFFDWDNKSYDWGTGGDLKYSRLYIKDMVDVHKGEEKGGFYSTPTYVTLNGALIRNLDKKFAQYADDEIGDGLVRTIVAIKASGGQPSFIIARASKDIMDIASEVDSIIEYLDYEVSTGNMTESNKKEFLLSMSHETKKSPLNKYVEAQHILQHEVMKRARGRDYLIRTPSASHHSRRLGIDDGNGIVALGNGDFTIKIIDQSKTFVSRGMPGATGSSKKIPMAGYIAGLPDKYHGDGALWVESEYLDKTAYNIGRVPTGPNSSKLREIKTRIRFISKDDEFGRKHYKKEVIPGEGRPLATEEQVEGTHYLALKHNEFVPEENIYITDEADNIIAYTANVDGSIQIYDGQDNRITMFGTLDEAKEPDGGSGVFKLDDRIATDILTLPEESRRIVKVPKQQGHSSATFPWMWMSHLYDSAFDGLRDALLTRMLNVARGNMDALFSARSNPQVMRALMGQFKSDGLTIMSEVDRLIEPTPGQMIQDGFMFPHIITGIVDPVKNRIVKENSYGGRRRGFGTFPVIKSDLSRTVVKNEDGVVLSADNLTMMRFLKDMLNVEGFGNDLVDNINEALKTRREYLMAGRWPVYTISSLFLSRIEKVMPHGHGDVVWFHPESATGKLQADYDGDNGLLLAPYFGQNYMDKTVINRFNDKSVKDAFENFESYVRLEYFKKSGVDYKMTAKKDMYIVTGKLGRGMNAQGMLMNAVSFLEDMYFKGLKLEVGGQTLVIREPNEENMVMGYAPLNDNVTQEMLDGAKMGTLVDKDGVVWESGDKYLKTTPLKQLHILLQAAVDNSKEYLLADWKFGGWKWIVPRIFIQDNGSPVGSKQSGSIASLVRKELMYNVSRRGVDMKDNRSQDIDGMFKTSKEVYELNQMSGVERGQRIKEKANARRVRYGKDSKLAKRTAEVEKITFNNKLLPLERLIAIPHESLLKYEQNNPNDKVHGNPLGYHPNRIQRAIMHTQQDMYSLQRETQRWYPETKEFEKDKEIGRRLVNEMTREFYKIAMQQRLYKDSTKSRITSAGYPYQEKITEFIQKWLVDGDSKKGLPSWSKLSEEQQAYATLRFLRGVLTFSSETHKKVGDKEKRLQNLIIDLKSKAAEENDLGLVERLENKIEKLEKQLDNIYTPKTYQNISRPRDIEKMLPMPLMHPDVWTTFANLYGPNLRRASSEKISLKSDARYEDRKRRTIEEILKECG